MSRESLIRRLPEIAFVLLFGGGLLLGGDSALAGIPKLLDVVTPDLAAPAGVQSAVQAGTSGPPGEAGVVRLAISDGFADSGVAPRVLDPAAGVPKPEWLLRAMQAARSAAPVEARPIIAICIDDLGEDLAGTDKALALPKEVTLSFFPYADATPFLAEAAERRGHRVLAHVPMQALNGADPGPMALKSGMSAEEIARLLGWNLSRVPGLVGINNHEGSRFTADPAALASVMATLRARHLFFFDSRTSAQTTVADAARHAGVMTAARDVFLDDDSSEAAVRAQLDRLAAEARRNGAAIAIGHPHDVTLKVLAKWLAEDHGVILVPLDEAVRLKAKREYMLAAR